MLKFMELGEFQDGLELALREGGFEYVAGSEDRSVFVAIDGPDSAAAVRIQFVTNKYGDQFVSIDSRVLVGLPTEDIPGQVFEALNSLNLEIPFSQWYLNEAGEIWTRLPFRAEFLDMEGLALHCQGVSEMVNDRATGLALSFLLGVPELLSKDETFDSEDIPGETELRALVAELPDRE